MTIKNAASRHLFEILLQFSKIIEPNESVLVFYCERSKRIALKADKEILLDFPGAERWT